jgi:hypothetical protein
VTSAGTLGDLSLAHLMRMPLLEHWKYLPSVAPQRLLGPSRKTVKALGPMRKLTWGLVTNAFVAPTETLGALANVELSVIQTLRRIQMIRIEPSYCARW